MRMKKYDLIIFSQTVFEASARNLIAQAQRLQPSSSILAIRSGEERHLESPTYQVDLGNPGGLRAAVAEILEGRSGRLATT
jgi:hypothetical protein